MKPLPEKPKEFWITNKSKTDVSLADLNLTIRAYSSFNLLDKKHFYYTWEQIYNSATRGSIYKKQKKIAIRKFAPYNKIPKKITVDEVSAIPSRERSIFEIKEEKFEELDISDEEFAAQNADSITV